LQTTRDCTSFRLNLVKTVVKTGRL